MTPEQKKAYMKIKSGEIEKVSVENVLTKTLRLQQVACGFYNTDRWKKDPETGKKTEVPVELIEIVPPTKNPKLRELLLVAREISHPMIIWVETMYEYKIVTEALGKRGEVVSIIGATPKEDRRGIIAKFQTGSVPFFVGTATAGGIGTTLTAARTVVYFSNGQRLEQRVQSEDRAHRKGQTGSVTIIDLVMQGTVDAAILQNHADKIDLAQYVKKALRDRIALEKFFNGEIDSAIVEDLKRGAITEHTGT
jgi:SNF2 family DNA or RNA helicase